MRPGGAVYSAGAAGLQRGRGSDSVLGESRRRGVMTRQVIETSDAPAAIGPYSQAIAVRGQRTVYCSGQIAIDPKSGQLLEGDVVAQARRVLDNLAAVLAAASMTFDNVVK